LGADTTVSYDCWYLLASWLRDEVAVVRSRPPRFFYVVQLDWFDFLSIRSYYKSMNTDSPTFQLFKERQSFLSGMRSIFDLSRPESKYNSSKSDAEADYKALYSDWCAIGKDMHEAVSQYEQEQS